MEQGQSRTFYYGRVSSAEQNLDRQIAAFVALGAAERDIVVDKQSGKDLNRPGYMALRNAMLRPGDTLVIKSLDRLSRNKAELKNELAYVQANGIRVKVLDLPTTMTDFPEGQEWIGEMVSAILVEVLSSIAQQERETIHKRQAEGIAVAKAKGKHLGRPKAVKPDNWAAVFPLWKTGQITAKEAMRRTGLKRTVFYTFAKEAG